MGSLLATQLQAVMQEGLLDSLLPFLTQDKILYKPQDLSSEGDTAGAAAFFPLSSLSRCGRSSDMKSRQNSSARLSRELTKEDKLVRCLVENKREIVIHVCDENRGAKKDFTCPQGLLMEKMEYFREITDGQHLEDVDISVHCDIKIFDWLMCWIKHDNFMEKPSLDTATVVSILVSASFLQVTPAFYSGAEVDIFLSDIRAGDGVPGLRLQEHEPHPHSDAHLQLCGRQPGHQTQPALQTIGD